VIPMDSPYNPCAGTSLSASWYLKRKAPGGKVAHYIDPVGLGPLCGARLRRDWEYVPEDYPVRMCSKCKGVELQASVGQEIDDERFNN
jgi:hypothetical protein